jgi:hypothetical protein
LPIGATVRTLSVHDNTVYIGGQFSGNSTNGNYSNIVSYDVQQQKLMPLKQFGLNGMVAASLMANSSKFYLLLYKVIQN